MRTIRCISLLTALWISFCGCTTTSGTGLRLAQKAENYPNQLHLPLENRIGTIPQILLDEIQSSDKTASYEPYNLSESERETFRTLLAQMPVALRTALDSEVNNIFFVNHFSGGGMTYCIWKDGKARYIVIFNPLTLHTSLSEWLTRRDNSTFDSENGEFALSETEDGNHPAILHTLIHEACHVFDFKNNITMDFQGELQPASRKLWSNQKTVVSEYDFPTRQHMSFYGFEQKKKVKLSEFLEDFETFSKGPFASLYATGNPFDEFAENQTYMILEKSFHVTLSLQIQKAGSIFHSYRPTANAKMIQRNTELGSIVKG